MAKNKLKNQEIMQKNVVEHEMLLSMWKANRMEQDKQVLTLSALAVGLLVSVRSEIDDCFSLVCWFVAGVSFLVSIGFILRLFSQHCDLIEMIQAEDKNNEEKRKDLGRSINLKTRFALWSFFIGATLTGILAVYIVVLPFYEGA